ncbi:hypothetical protein ACFSHP_19360 [Novosphingobium panipatense]
MNERKSAASGVDAMDEDAIVQIRVTKALRNEIARIALDRAG